MLNSAWFKLGRMQPEVNSGCPGEAVTVDVMTLKDDLEDNESTDIHENDTDDKADNEEFKNGIGFDVDGLADILELLF